MTSVTREFGWAMGHRLQHHRGLCRFPHGHNYSAHVTVSSAMSLWRSGRPDDGMVVDFTTLDAALRRVLDPWDHAFMVETGDPLADLLRQFEGAVLGDAPRGSSKVVLVPWAPTAENIAREIMARTQEALPKPTMVDDLCLRVTRVAVHEGPRSVATAEQPYVG